MSRQVACENQGKPGQDLFNVHVLSISGSQPSVDTWDSTAMVTYGRLFIRAPLFDCTDDAPRCANPNPALVPRMRGRQPLPTHEISTPIL